jgi:hypothetical protein
MSAFDYGPSLSDQGFGSDDIPVGECAECTALLDEGDMQAGIGVYVGERLLCRECADDALSASPAPAHAARSTTAGAPRGEDADA